MEVQREEDRVVVVVVVVVVEEVAVEATEADGTEIMATDGRARMEDYLEEDHLEEDYLEEDHLEEDHLEEDRLEEDHQEEDRQEEALPPAQEEATPHCEGFISTLSLRRSKSRNSTDLTRSSKRGPTHAIVTGCLARRSPCFEYNLRRRLL